MICKRCRGNFVSNSDGHRQGDEYCSHCFEVCRLMHNAVIRGSGRSYTRKKEVRSGKLFLVPVVEPVFKKPVEPHVPLYQCLKCGGSPGCSPCTCKPVTLSKGAPTVATSPLHYHGGFYPCFCPNPPARDAPSAFGPGAPRLEPSPTWEDPQGSDVTWGPTRCPGCGALLAQEGPLHCLVCQTPLQPGSRAPGAD